MPRKARIDAPGALHHVIVRGIEGWNIFRSDRDRENFLDRIDELFAQTNTGCFAWALMPNHVHLLLKTGSTPISVFMSRLLTGYAVWFNRRHKRHGQLFQNRYKSILCQEEAYFKELLRYIHLNPLRAGLVENIFQLDRYPWCGHAAVMGTIPRTWQNCDYVYRYFADRPALARKKYRSFVENGIADGHRPDLTGGGLVRSAGGWTALKGFRKAGIRIKGDERILGDSDFVETVLASANEAFEQKYDLRAMGFDFERAVERVADVMNMTADEVTALGKSPKTVAARALLCFWTHRRLGMKTVEIAGRLQLCQSAVSRLSRKGEKIGRACGAELIPEKRMKS